MTKNFVRLTMVLNPCAGDVGLFRVSASGLHFSSSSSASFTRVPGLNYANDQENK